MEISKFQWNKSLKNYGFKICGIEYFTSPVKDEKNA